MGQRADGCGAAVTAAGAQFGQPGYETDLLYLACLATLVLAGSGPFTVDGLLASFRNRRERYITEPVGRTRSDIP